MTAAVLESLNAPLKIRELSMPAPDLGQVHVRILATGICGAQLQEIRGEKASGMPIPRLLGHEGCGEVVEVGDGVTTVERGDRVVCHWRKGEGIDALYGTLYRDINYERITDIPAGPIHTFCTEAIISENRCTAVPKKTPVDLAALLGCALSTALACIENDAKLRMGELFGISGMGGVGKSLFGAACAIGAIYEHSGQVDCMFDTTGNSEQIEACLDRLLPGGRLILIGQPAPDAAIRIPYARRLFDGTGATIIASQGGQFSPARDIPRYVRMWNRGLLAINSIITHRLPLAQINEGLDLMREGKSGRVLIDMTL